MGVVYTTLFFYIMNDSGNKGNIKTLGIDSSTKSSGYSLFVDGEFKNCGHIDHSNIKSGQERLALMMKDLVDLIENEHPDIVSWEIPVVIRNPQTQRDLSMLTGAIMSKCVELDIFYCPFRPTEWRKLVADDGEKIPRKRDELKKWGIEKVKNIYGIEVDNDDESDSILIGLAYINLYK